MIELESNVKMLNVHVQRYLHFVAVAVILVLLLDHDALLWWHGSDSPKQITLNVKRRVEGQRFNCCDNTPLNPSAKPRHPSVTSDHQEWNECWEPMTIMTDEMRNPEKITTDRALISPSPFHFSLVVCRYVLYFYNGILYDARACRNVKNFQNILIRFIPGNEGVHNPIIHTPYMKIW